MSTAPVKPISKTRATKLVREIRKTLTELAPTVAELFEGRGWVALGYADWSTLIREEFGGPLMLPKPERAEAVAVLSESGMSNRAIADTLGVTEITVRRDSTATNVAVDEPRKVVGKDGKTRTYTGKRTRPGKTTKAEPEPDIATPTNIEEALAHVYALREYAQNADDVGTYLRANIIEATLIGEPRSDAIASTIEDAVASRVIDRLIVAHIGLDGATVEELETHIADVELLILDRKREEAKPVKKATRAKRVTRKGATVLSGAKS